MLTRFDILCYTTIYKKRIDAFDDNLGFCVPANSLNYINNFKEKLIMKKTFAKLLAVVMVVAMLSCMFVSCKKDDDKNDSVFFIGATGPLTGDNASYGNSVNRGALIAIDEINNELGGLDGVKFKFEMKDDKADPKEATNGYNSLYEAGMHIALGSVTSGSCKSFAASAKEDNLFFMTPSASEQAIIETGTNAFRVCFGDPDQGTLAAQELKEFTNIGVVYDTSSSYAVGIYDAFKAEMEKLGKTFKVETFDAESNKDFSTQAEALKDCDAIFLPLYYTEASLIAKAACGKDFDGLILGCDGFDGIAAYIDETITVEIKYITPFDAASTDEKVSKFVNTYKAKYNETPDQFAADGYDAVMAIYYAMKAAGVNDTSISVSDLCDKVVAAITASTFSYTGLTGKMTWDTTGACAKVPVIVTFNAK